MAIIGGDAQAVEFRIPKKAKLDGKLFNKVSFPQGVKIGALWEGYLIEEFSIKLGFHCSESFEG